MARSDLHPVSTDPPRWFGLAYLLIFLAGVGFFLLSFIALGVLPGRRLAQQMEAQAPTDMAPYTAAELRGRRLYISLGCGLCHTQQIRFLSADVKRWGAPTAAWETRNDFPQLWGTRRIGPDLARESSVRSDDWQLTHLYNPRWVVADSIMPAFTWLFDGAPNRPTAAAKGLLAYLRALGRASQTRPHRAADGMADMSAENLFSADAINPQQARLDDSAPHLTATGASSARGRTLYARHCAACHGSQGDGAGPGAAGLSPSPTNLRQHRFSTRGLAQILWNGRAGSAMPAWRDFSEADLTSLILYVQALHTAVATPASAPVLAQGAALYADHCVRCHGVQGRGDGSDALTLLPRPTDFSAAQADSARILQVLKEGVGGTGMPPWPQFTPPDQQALAAFVRSLFATSAE